MEETVKPSYLDIPQFIRRPNYVVDIGWDYLPTYYYNAVSECRLDINPPFQRGHVWTDNQKVRYVEFILQGGQSGRDIYTNSPGWSEGATGDENNPYILVDGKQRLDAVLGYLNNEFPIFGGNYHRDYSGRINSSVGLRWHVNELRTYREVLQWYVDLNAGGVVHSDSEIARVRELIVSGACYTFPTLDVLKVQSRIGSEIILRVIAEDEADAARRKVENAETIAKVSVKAKKKRWLG